MVLTDEFPTMRPTHGHASFNNGGGLNPLAAWTVSAFAITSMMWYCTFSPLFDIQMTDSPFSIGLRLANLGAITIPDLVFLLVLATLFGSRLRNLDSLDVIVIATGSWLLLAALVNVFVTHTMALPRFLNYTARLAPYWLVLPLLRRLPSKQKKCVLIAGVVLASIVAVVHIYVVLTKNEPLLLRLYYAWWQPGTIGNVQMRYLLRTRPSVFVRAVPDGIALITSVYVACLAGLASNKSHALAWSMLAVLSGIAALITLERSLAMVLLILMPVVGLMRYRRSSNSVARLLVIPLIAVAGFGVVSAFSQYDLTGEFTNRFDQFSAALDPYDNPRLQDSVDGAREILESPVFGTGFTDPQEFHSDTGADAHGLIMLGLLGGIPLIILTILAVYRSIQIGMQNTSWQRTAGVFIVIHVVALMAINTAPGFVWARSLLPTVIGMALAAPVGVAPRVR